jgi:hypothetical protein
MKIVEMQEIKDHFSKMNIIDESELKDYIVEKYPEKSGKLFRYYLTDLYKSKIFYRYDVGKLKQCKDRVQFTFSCLNDKDIRNRSHPYLTGGSILMYRWLYSNKIFT